MTAAFEKFKTVSTELAERMGIPNAQEVRRAFDVFVKGKDEEANYPFEIEHIVQECIPPIHSLRLGPKNETEDWHVDFEFLNERFSVSVCIDEKCESEYVNI